MDSKAEYQLSTVLALDKKYKKLFIDKGAFNYEVEKYRNILRNSFEQIFLIDINYAVSNDIESSFWRNIFYLVIDDFRKRNKEYKKLYRTLNSDDKFEFTVYSSSFHSFIKESISYYTDFIQKLTKLYNLDQVSKIFKPIELSLVNFDIEPIDPTQVNEKNKELAVKVCHQTLIYLGDLIRYSEMYSDITYKNWNISKNYYQMAIQLVPCNGNPFNQLAVIASYEMKNLIAIENYMRSLAVSVPFTTSSDNLYLAIEKIKSKKDILKEKFKNRKYPNSFSKVYITNMKSDFLNDYERLINYTYGSTKNVEKFLELKPYILDVFSILLETKYLDTDELITLSIINMALHYLLVNRHLTKLCKIKKESIPDEIDEPSPTEEVMKDELIKFNIEFFNIILKVALQKEKTITINSQKFSYANVVSQEDNKKKQTNSQDKKEDYPNMKDLLINIIIYTQWCKVKLNEGYKQLTENTEWISKLKDVLTVVNNISPAKKKFLFNNKQNDLFISENGCFLFKNAMYLRGFIPLEDEIIKKQKLLSSYYYKNFEDISSTSDEIINDQIQYLIKLAYELSEVSDGNLLFSIKESPINHKLKLIFTNSKDEALKMDGKINIITGKSSNENINVFNEDENENVIYNEGYKNIDDSDDENLQETIVFTGRNKNKGKQKEENQSEFNDSINNINLNSESIPLTNSKNNTISNSNNNNNTAQDEGAEENNDNINIKINNNESKIKLTDLKDDLDVSMDLNNILKESENKLPHNQNNDYNLSSFVGLDSFYTDSFINKNSHLNNSNGGMTNRTSNSAFLSNTSTPSGIFMSFDWNKDYSYSFSNSIIPVQNPNRSNSNNDALSIPKQNIINDSIKNKRNSTPENLNNKWLQNQNMFTSNNQQNKSKSSDNNFLYINNSEHPSIPPGLSVQTKNKDPQIFSNSTPSSAVSENFVSTGIFSKMENQSKSNVTNKTNQNNVGDNNSNNNNSNNNNSNNNNNNSNNNDNNNNNNTSNNNNNTSNNNNNNNNNSSNNNNNNKNTMDSIITNNIDKNNELGTIDVISPGGGLNSVLPLPQPSQQTLQPIQPSSHINTPIGSKESATTVNTNILNNPLFMSQKPPQTVGFPPFPNPQLTPQKQSSSSQQQTPSANQSPLFFNNINSNITTPKIQMFISNQDSNKLLSLKSMCASPESSNSSQNSLNVVPSAPPQNNPYLPLPYSAQMILPGLNPQILQQQQQQQQQQQLQQNFPQSYLNGNFQVNSNPPMNIPIGLGPGPGINNNFFSNSPINKMNNMNNMNNINNMNTMNNLQNVNVDPRLYSIPPNPNNLNGLNGLMNNPKTVTPNIGSVYVKMPMPVSSSSHNPPYSLQSPTVKMENGNQSTPVNPLLNLLSCNNNPGTGISYSLDNTTNSKNNDNNNG